MRDPNRLDVFYDELKRMHKEHVPDWRVGQLLLNVLGGADPFFWEEDKMLETFKKYFGEEE